MFFDLFILVYAVLVKTKVLGDNNMVSLFLSLIIASFFIVNVNIAKLTEMTTSWFVVFLVCFFMIILLLSFVGKDVSKLFTENKSLAGVVIAIVILLFVVSTELCF